MREGIPNLIKNPERVSAETGQGLQDQLRQTLLDFLDPVLRKFFDTKKIHKDFENLSKAQEDAKRLSSEAGEFFRSLIPNGLRKPEIEGVPKIGSSNWIMILENMEVLRLLKDEVKKLSRKEYRKKKIEILKDSIHGRERLAVEGEVKETEKFDGIVEQTVTNAWGQSGNQNLIYERVSNTLNRPKNRNRAESSLVIQNIESGVSLDLNALLPSGYRYAPQVMDKELYQLDPESAITGVSYKQKEIADLKDYKMGVSEPEGFAVRPYYRIVDYGDLRKTGGILSLLHEVAHSWQNKYYHTIEKGRAKFENLYEIIIFFIFKLDLSKDNEQYEEPEKIWMELEKAGIECLDKNGLEVPSNEEGVINVPNIHYNLVQLIEKINLLNPDISPQERERAESILAKSKPQIRFYPIKSDVLHNAINNYVAEERDAWAHAIRMVRFLRDKGLDVEPELEKLEDFKAVIDPCLASYQDHLEMNILNENAGYGFKKQSK